MPSAITIIIILSRCYFLHLYGHWIFLMKNIWQHRISPSPLDIPLPLEKAARTAASSVRLDHTNASSVQLDIANASSVRLEIYAVTAPPPGPRPTAASAAFMQQTEVVDDHG